MIHTKSENNSKWAETDENVSTGSNKKGTGKI